VSATLGKEKPPERDHARQDAGNRRNHAELHQQRYPDKPVGHLFNVTYLGVSD